MDSTSEPITAGNIVAVGDPEQPSSQLIESPLPAVMPTNVSIPIHNNNAVHNNSSNFNNNKSDISMSAFSAAHASAGLPECINVVPSMDTATKPASGFHKREQKTAEDFDIFHNDRDEYSSDDSNHHNMHKGHHHQNHDTTTVHNKNHHLNNTHTKGNKSEFNGTASYDGDNVSVDSYGLPMYHRRYDANYGDGSSDLSVPWNLRRAMKKDRFSFFDFMLSPQFWFQFEFALRVTACAVLVPSIILALDVHGNPFISKFMVFSASVLAAKTSVGDSFAYVFTFIRSGCIWLPLSVIGGALNLGNHIVGWCFYYTIMIFFMAVFTESTCHRICLLLFNTSMVGLLTDKSRREEYACRVMVDWCIGTGLCFIATFIPYPLLCKREAHRLLSRIGKNTATAFCGLVYSFWSPSNVERNMAMSKVRLMIDSLDVLMPEFESREAFTLYEFLFESSEVRELREMKFHFFEQIRVNMSSMNRVLDMVEATPDAIDKSDRSRAFGELLVPQLTSVGEAFDEIIEELSHANTKRKILELEQYFSTLHDRFRQMQDAYLTARRMLFYEYTSSTMEEFVPLMTFYIFTIVCFHDTVYEFQRNVEKYEPSCLRTPKVLWMKVFGDPFLESVEFVQKLFKLRNRREVQRLIEAVKICGAMILTIGFTYLINVDMNSFTGPNIIAFITGSNPVEAVQASIVRLTGCVIGTVLGFFASTYSNTSVQRVASLCTLMFAGTFLRNDKEYGIMAIYGMFVLIPLDTVMKATINDTVERMNQNTFGIFFYIVISAAIFPLSPSTILRNKRKNILKRMNDAVARLTNLFEAPLPQSCINGRSGTRRDEPFHYDPYETNQPDHDSGELEGDAHTYKENNNNNNNIVNIHSNSNSNSNSNNIADSKSECKSMTHLMGTSTSSTGQGVRNRSIIILPGKDAAMDELDGVLRDLSHRLKATRAYVEFAKNERTLLEKDYPVKACAATYYHMYRMTILLRTMWLSWNVLRGQCRYTSHTQHMLHSLYPIAVDISRAFSRFVHLLTYMMDDPSINLESEIMKSVLDLIASSKELHLRKSQIMLMLINSSVEHYRDKTSGMGTRLNSTDGLNALADVEAFNRSRLHCLHDSHNVSPIQLPLHPHKSHGHVRQMDKHADLICHAAEPLPLIHLHNHNNNDVGSMNTSSTNFRGHLTHKFSSYPETHISRAATIDPSSLKLLYDMNGSPTRHMFKVASNDRNVTVLPFLRHQSGTGDTDDGSVEPVRLPDKFTFPVTSEDAEGMHSFTLCLDMFANEAKMLMMSIGAMNDFRRSKMESSATYMLKY